MKIIAVADTHTVVNDFGTLSSGDVFVHAGDFCNLGSLMDAKYFNDMLGKMKCQHKIVVAGNHDRALEDNIGIENELLSNAVYLRDKTITIEGIKFYGSPWQLPFNNWAFNKPEKELKKIFDLIPKDTDVLITHSPPYGIMDFVRGRHLGSVSLRKRIEQIKPRCCIFGHIHEGYGKYVDSKTGITYINASLIGGEFKEIHKPFEIII